MDSTITGSYSSTIGIDWEVFPITMIALSVLILFMYFLSSKEVYKEMFCWSNPMDGVTISTAKLWKLRGIEVYIITHDCDYLSFHPKEHPNYKNFLEKVQKIKYKTD